MNHYLLTITMLLASILFAAQGSGNRIFKGNFNFALQSGYIYSRMDNGYFKNKDSYSFETGFRAYRITNIPLVEVDSFKNRTLLQIPFSFYISPSSNIELQIHSDLIGELPYKDGRPIHHSIGGNSPRFLTKISLLDESNFIPATAFTVGVTFSSAKPFNIWNRSHNYKESNGLAGPGTGVSDYLLLFTLSKNVSRKTFLHGRVGLLPMGDPTVADTTINYRGSSQSDEIPYGFSFERDSIFGLNLKSEVVGMVGILKSTPLSHYSIFRNSVSKKWKNRAITIDFEKGLTRNSDDFVVGMYLKFDFVATHN